PLTDHILETARLRLEPWAPAHLDGLHVMNGDPTVMRHIGKVATREETVASIARPAIWSVPAASSILRAWSTTRWRSAGGSGPIAGARVWPARPPVSWRISPSIGGRSRCWRGGG